MRQFTMATIGGPYGSPFLFNQPRNPALGGLFSAYVTDQQYLDRARAAVGSFDQLKDRLAKIADKAARDKIIARYATNTDSPGTGLSYRNLVAGWIAKADASGDPGDGFADDGKHGRKNMDTLTDFVNNMSSDIQDAELTYGMLPGPAAPPPVVAAAPAAPGGSGILPYVVGGAGIAAVLVLVGAFK